MVEIRTRILGIAPYDGMRTAMENAAQAYPNVLLDVQTGDLDEGQAIVQNIPPNTYDCIISRGGTADLIRRVTDLPVVDIQISVYDVLRAIKLAENYTDLYAIVGFPSVTESAHTLCSLLTMIWTPYREQCRRCKAYAGASAAGWVPDGGVRHGDPYHRPPDGL